VSTHCCKRPTPRPPHHMNTVELVPSSTGQQLVKGVNWCGARTHHWMRAPTAHPNPHAWCVVRAHTYTHNDNKTYRLGCSPSFRTPLAGRGACYVGGSHPVMRACTAPVHPFDQPLTGARRYQLYCIHVVWRARSWPFTTMRRHSVDRVK
jgi:hypothetical protein